MIPAATPAMDLDALVIGRAGMDLYPRPVGTKTEHAETFFADMGGSAGNIAAAMAKLGMKVALAAPVSDDPVGRFVARRLASLGIEHVTPEPVEGSARTSLALAETIAEGSETIIYRNGAADFELQGADLARHTSRARTVIATGTALAQEPSRGATLKALADAAFAVLDLDYRPYSWASLDEARLVYAEAAEKADLVVGNEEEVALLAGCGDPRAFAEASPKAFFYKEGEKGVTALLPGAEPHFCPPFAVDSLKPFGAGDAFLGAALTALLSGADLPSSLRYGAANAALVVSREGCASAMGTAAEIETFLTTHEAR